MTLRVPRNIRKGITASLYENLKNTQSDETNSSQKSRTVPNDLQNETFSLEKRSFGS